MNWEIVRTVILFTGWPLLIGGTVFLLLQALRFQRAMHESIFGKLITALVLACLVSMYGLGAVATSFMFVAGAPGVQVVLPVFFIWVAAMTAIFWMVGNMERESVRLNDLYLNFKKERDSAEQASTKIKAILENIGEALIVTDEERIVTLVNQAAVDLLGFSEEELAGSRWPDLLKPVDEEGNSVPLEKTTTYLAINYKKEIIGDSFRYTRKDGTVFIGAVGAAPFVIGGRVFGASIVMRDVTKEKEIDKAKSEFVALASHQLRTPLTAVKWQAEFLLQNVGKSLSSDQVKEYVAQILESNRRMTELVTSLLNVSRIDMGTLILQLQNVDMVHLTENILTELAHPIAEKKINLVKEYADTLLKPEADPQLISIVLQNIIGNAVKYTPKGGSVTISMHSDKKEFFMSVTDTGYGIPESEQRKIFTKLYRASNAKNEESEGNGLGLYVARSVVQRHGGVLYFESKENEGSTFYVTLPLKAQM